MKLLAGYLVPHPPIIIPEIGLGEEKKATATCQRMHEMGKEVAMLKPKTIVVISPHGPLFTDAIAIRTQSPLKGNLKAFGAGSVQFEQATDLAFIDRLLKRAFEQHIPSVKFDQQLSNRFDLSEDADHGIIVPLHFINQYYNHYQVVALTYGLLSPDALYEFGMLIKETAETLGREIVVIASGDLSHHLLETSSYNFREEGPSFDRFVIHHLAEQDYLPLLTVSSKWSEKAGECGKRSLEILLGALDAINHETQVKSYEGPFGVGYGVVSFLPQAESIPTPSLLDDLKVQLKLQMEESLAQEDIYIQLARYAIEHYIQEGYRPILPDYAQVPELLGKSRGVFVSIKDRGGLRGCMGCTVGFEINLASEIMATAIKSATQDPRFDPIEPEELKNLTISVDLLMPAEKIESLNDLNPQIYGLIVYNDHKRGLLLPQLEGINTVEEQLRIVLNKAGIKANEQYNMERFLVERHEV